MLCNQHCTKYFLLHACFFYKISLFLYKINVKTYQKTFVAIKNRLFYKEKTLTRQMSDKQISRLCDEKVVYVESKIL